MVSLDHLKGKSRDMTTVYNMESLQESTEAVSVPPFAFVLTRQFICRDPLLRRLLTRTTVVDRTELDHLPCSATSRA